MRNIINKTKSFIVKTADVVFYVVVCWHIAISHQPEPDHHEYALIELYEHGMYADTEDFMCKDFVLWEKGSLLGLHQKAEGAYNLETGKYVGEDNIKCRYILKRPTNWHQMLIIP